MNLSSWPPLSPPLFARSNGSRGLEGKLDPPLRQRSQSLWHLQLFDMSQKDHNLHMQVLFRDHLFGSQSPPFEAAFMISLEG